MGRMKKKRQVRMGRRKGRQKRKESVRVGRANGGGTGWELKGGKGNGSSNYKIIAEFGLCCRFALSCFNLSGQPSTYTLCDTMETDSIQKCLAMQNSHVVLK
jgi:hypothetical protein